MALERDVESKLIWFHSNACFCIWAFGHLGICADAVFDLLGFLFIVVLERASVRCGFFVHCGFREELGTQV